MQMQNNTFIAIENCRVELQMRTIQFRWKITELTWKLLNTNRKFIQYTMEKIKYCKLGHGTDIFCKKINQLPIVLSVCQVI